MEYKNHAYFFRREEAVAFSILVANKLKVETEITEKDTKHKDDKTTHYFIVHYNYPN
jgi:hypothetical protein